MNREADMFANMGAENDQP